VKAMFSREEWERIIDVIKKERNLGLKIIFKTKEGPRKLEQEWKRNLIKFRVSVRDLRNLWSPNSNGGVLEIRLDGGLIIHGIWILGDKNELVSMRSIVDKSELDLSSIIRSLASSLTTDMIGIMSIDRFPEG